MGVAQGTYAQQADAQHTASNAAAHAAALAAATADNAQQQHEQQHHQQQGGRPGEVTMTPGGGRTPIISISDAPVYQDAHGDAAAAAAAALEHEQQVLLRCTKYSPWRGICASLCHDSRHLNNLVVRQNNGLTFSVMLAARRGSTWAAVSSRQAALDMATNILPSA